MTDRELMQQALDALTTYDGTNGEGKRKRVLAALRERLAQPEQDQKPPVKTYCGGKPNYCIPEQEPVATVVKRQYEDGTYAGNALDWAGRNCEDDFPVGTKLYTDPQPVKFNCTVVDADHPNGVPLSQWGKQQKQKPFCYHDGRNIVGKEYAHHCDVFPLYTHRAAQQPLTDEQFNRIPELSVIPPHHVEMVVRAIEAAHGIQEKNT